MPRLQLWRCDRCGHEVINEDPERGEWHRVSSGPKEWWVCQSCWEEVDDRIEYHIDGYPL